MLVRRCSFTDLLKLRSCFPILNFIYGLPINPYFSSLCCVSLLHIFQVVKLKCFLIIKRGICDYLSDAVLVYIFTIYGHVLFLFLSGFKCSLYGHNTRTFQVTRLRPLISVIWKWHYWVLLTEKYRFDILIAANRRLFNRYLFRRVIILYLMLFYTMHHRRVHGLYSVVIIPSIIGWFLVDDHKLTVVMLIPKIIKATFNF